MRPALLMEREETHGRFSMNAEISQGLKAAFRAHRYSELPPAQREALDMIALKVSRILSGQGHYADHWDDVAGYAQLGSEACRDDLTWSSAVGPRVRVAAE